MARKKAAAPAVGNDDYDDDVAEAKLAEKFRKVGAAAQQLAQQPVVRELLAAALTAAAASLTSGKSGGKAGAVAGAVGGAVIGGAVKRALLDAARSMLDEFDKPSSSGGSGETTLSRSEPEEGSRQKSAANRQAEPAEA